MHPGFRFQGIALLLTTIGFIASSSLMAQEAQRQILTDTATGTYVGDVTLTAKNFGGAGAASKWSIRKETLRGGKQDGVDLITIHNGAMVIRVIPTRGMNVLDMTVGDFRLGWESPVKEVVHPKFVDLDTRGGLGWLDGFNEWMVRCGLEFAGHPGLDKFITNTGDESEMELTLHGKIGNIPASQVEIRVEEKAPHRITLRGVVHERMFFGPKIELVTELSTIPGSHEITITDWITNRGADDQEMMLIYHTNYGAPLLEEGAHLDAPIKTLTPMNETAVAGINHWETYAGPKAGFIENVYLTELNANRKDETLVCLSNKNRDRAASIAYNVKQLPYFTIWKNTTAKENGYVTGLEPGTCHPFNRSVERKHGRVPKLKPGETREYSLTFGLHLGKENVKQVRSQVSALQGDQQPTIHRQPPEHE